MIKALLAIALMAQAVAAECMAEGQVPRTIDFGNDQVARNIIVKNGLVTHETELNGKPMLNEARYGLYSEVMQMGGKVNRFDWSARQPMTPADLPAGREVEFRATISGAVPGELVWAIINWGPERISVAGCTYTALHLKSAKVLQPHRRWWEIAGSILSV